MAAGDINLDWLCNSLRRFGLFAMSIGMSHFLLYFRTRSATTEAPNSVFAAFLMWILGIWLVILSCAIPVLPAGRRIAAQIVEFIEILVLGFHGMILPSIPNRKFRLYYFNPDGWIKMNESDSFKKDLLDFK